MTMEFYAQRAKRLLAISVKERSGVSQPPKLIITLTTIGIRAPRFISSPSNTFHKILMIGSWPWSTTPTVMENRTQSGIALTIRLTPVVSIMPPGLTSFTRG